MKTIAYLITLTVFAFFQIPDLAGAAGIKKASKALSYTLPTGNYQFTVPGVNRLYDVHVPPAYKTTSPMPVVLIYHGGSMAPPRMKAVTGMNITANVKKFIAVYPYGTPKKIGRQTSGSMRFWNPALVFPDYPYFNDPYYDTVDDVGYTRALLDDLKTHFNVDTARVYAVGASNGGLLVNRLACELSDRLAAVASVAGPLYGPEAYCDLARKTMPILYMHGTADNFMPYDGGFPYCPEVQQHPMRSAQETVDFWIDKNHCVNVPEIVYQNGDVTCVSYKNFDQSAQVEFCTINDGGHTWPGGAEISFPFKDPGCETGLVSNDVSANDVIWEFFKQYSKQS